MANDLQILDEYLNTTTQQPTETQITPPVEETTVQEYFSPIPTPPSKTPTYLEGFQPDKIEDRSIGYQVFQGTYTLDDLQKDPEFLARSERFMENIGTDEEIFEYLRDTDFSLSSAIARAGQIKGWSDEAKADYNYLRNKFDNADIGSTKQYLNLAADLTIDMIADPINWLTVAFFAPSGGLSGAAGLAAKEVAKKGLMQITKDGLKNAKKPALFGALEGSVWTGAHDYFLQNADVELGLRDEVDFNQTAISTGLGFGFGGAFGGAVGAFTSITPALRTKIFKYSNEDDIIKRADNIDKKLAEEEYGDDKVVDEILIKDSEKVDKRKRSKKEKDNKRIRKRDEALSNTFGKVTTQFVKLAENSKALQNLLGKFRYDWARTFKEGAKGIEAESYGLALSVRYHGYLMEMRQAINNLNRSQDFRKNTIRQDQNDQLLYLLRLKNKEFNELDKAGELDSYGVVADSAKDIRILLNKIFDDGVNQDLLTRSQFVDHFFPRHFSHAKIADNPEPLINIIRNSKHSEIKNEYAESDMVRVTEASGRETTGLVQGAEYIDAKSFKNKQGKGRNFLEEANGDESKARDLKAKAIVENMLDKKYTPFQFGDKDNAGGGHQFLQHRVFADLDDNILQDYLENDVEKVLESYILDTSRAITRTEFFGKTKASFEKTYLIPIRQQLLDSGVEPEDADIAINKLRKMHERVTGLDTDKIAVKNAAGSWALDWLKLSQQMAHLPLATLSSLTEPLILLSRVNTVEGKVSAAKDVATALVKGVKKDVDKFSFFVKRVSGKEVKGFADMQDEYWTEAYKVGLAMEQAVMERIEGLTGDALNSSTAKMFQNAFFKANLLASWTGAVQLASFTTGKRLIRENSERLAKGGLRKSEETLLKKQLNELGINDKQAVQWYKNSLDPETGEFSQARSQGTSTSRDFVYARKNKEGNTVLKTKARNQVAFYNNQYQRGANRFTREIILNPSTAEANRPLWFSHPAGQLLAQFAGYPTVFNNTILKRWINEGIFENKRETSARIVGTAISMTAIATFMNAVRSSGRSLEEDDGTIVLEAVQRWGGLGPADYAYRFQQNAVSGSGQAGSLLKTPTGPIVSDVFDAVLYRKGLLETLGTNVPFYSALPKDVRDSLKKTGRTADKNLWGNMFPLEKKAKEPKIITPYAKGGVVNVPNASTEPDEKKVRGMPFTYAELGGVLAQDVEDRRGFALGGLVNDVVDLSPDDNKDDVIRHLTKELRKDAPIFESPETVYTYKDSEAKEFTSAVTTEAVRYVDSDKISDLDTSIQKSQRIGMKVTTKPQKSGNKKIKHKGRITVVRPLNMGVVSEGTLTGSGVLKLIKNNEELQSNIINNSPLENEDAKLLLTKLLSDYKDTEKLIQNFSKYPREKTQPLLDIKQSIKVRETLTDIGYDSIQYNKDNYIIFNSDQFKVTKRLKLRSDFSEGGNVEEEKDSLKLFGKDGFIFDPSNPLDYAIFIPGVGAVAWGAKVASATSKAAKTLKNFPKTVYHGGQEFDKMKFGRVDKPILTEGLHRDKMSKEIPAVYTSADPKYAAGYMERFRSLRTNDQGILDHLKIDNPKVQKLRSAEVKAQIESYGYPGFMKIDISDVKPNQIHLWDKPTKGMTKQIDKAIETERMRRKTEVGIDPLASNIRIGELRQLKDYKKLSIDDPTYFPNISLFQRNFLQENNIRLMTKSTHMDNMKLQSVSKRKGKSEPSEYILLDEFPVKSLTPQEKDIAIKSYQQLIKEFFEDV